MSSGPIDPGILSADGVFPSWIRHGFTTRTGGASEGRYASLNLAFRTGDDVERVRENHRRVGRALGFDAAGLATVHQVHGTDIVTVRTAAEAPSLREISADGLLVLPDAGARGPIAAAVRTADCCPVVIARTDVRAAAVLHCGWRSVVAGIVGIGVRRLLEAAPAPKGSVPLAAAIGPCIGPEAFEVGEDVAERFERFAGREVVLRRPDRPKPHVDLALAARIALVRAGVSAASIGWIRRCTASEPESFFSYRRDGPIGGRQAGVVVVGPSRTESRLQS